MEEFHSQPGLAEPDNQGYIRSLTIAQTLGMLGILILAQVFVAIPFTALMAQLPEWMSLLTLAVYTLSFGLGLWLIIKIWKWKTFRFSAIDVIPVLILTPMTIALSLLMEPVIEIVPLPERLQEIFAQLVGSGIIGFITVAIIAPVLEEVIFRGIILEGLLRRYPPWTAIFWSSFLFGIAHLNPWQFFAGLVAGTFIGWVYWRTRSLWPCILIHFVNNGLSFFVIFFLGEEAVVNSTRSMMDNIPYILLLVGCLLIFGSGAYWLDNYWVNQKPNNFAGDIPHEKD